MRHELIVYRTGQSGVVVSLPMIHDGESIAAAIARAYRLWCDVERVVYLARVSKPETVALAFA